jgi:hypothetical protein
MKTRILVGMYLLIVLVACNKESNVTIPIVKEPTYYPLTTGSYWVYNTYKIDSLKNEELISENDTTAIIGDTNINGHQYKVFYGKKYGHGSIKTEKYLRDSLGYIVDSNGEIVFSQTNFTDTLYSLVIPYDMDTLYYEFTKLQSVADEKILPAGAFDSVLNNQLKFVYWKEPNKPTFNLDNLYAPNVGKILNQNCYAGMYLQDKSYYEERLIKYFIAQ